MEENEYKLDGTVLQSLAVEEAYHHVTYWNNKTGSERLNAACFIINQIFCVIAIPNVVLKCRGHPNQCRHTESNPYQTDETKYDPCCSTKFEFSNQPCNWQCK